MRLYATAERLRLYMEVVEPSLRDFLHTDRESTRRDVAAALAALFKKGDIAVRFEDECKECGTVKQPGHRGYADEYNGFCPNPACVAGFPADPELRRLMRKFPYRPLESAADYINRIKTEWRKNKKVVPQEDT